MEYKKYKCKAGSVVEMTTPEQIKSELYNYGPVEAAFEVYEDFFSYSSGVYQHVTGKLEGGHAIKVIGWGKEAGLDYWLCVNSWGPKWGIEGHFKIKMGECGIDDTAYACMPQLPAPAQQTE